MLTGFEWLEVKVQEPARRTAALPGGPALLQQRSRGNLARTVLRQACVRSERRFQRTSFTCGRYCSCFCVSVPFSRMPPLKQGKTKVATKKKSRPGGPRPGAGRPPIQPGRSAVKIRLDSEVISAVDTVAKLRKLDRSRVIEGALRQWLKEDKTAPGV